MLMSDREGLIRTGSGWGSFSVGSYADGIVEERSNAFACLIASDFASLPPCTVHERFPFVLAQNRKRVRVPEEVELGFEVIYFCGIYRLPFPAHFLIT